MGIEGRLKPDSDFVGMCILSLFIDLHLVASTFKLRICHLLKTILILGAVIYQAAITSDLQAKPFKPSSAITCRQANACSSCQHQLPY